MESSTTTAVVAIVLLGGAGWYYLRQKAAADAAEAAKLAAPKDEGSGIGKLLGISEDCITAAEANMYAGYVCGIWEVSKKVWKVVKEPIEHVIDGCLRPISKESLATFEATNRTKNGPCRAYIKTPGELCALHRFRPVQGAPAATAGGACIAYVNGCSPLAFAGARTKCKPGTHLYQPNTARADVAGAAGTTTRGTGHSTRDVPLSRQIDALGAPFAAWIRGVEATAAHPLGDDSHDPVTTTSVRRR
jgi:hypothetical protein